MSADQPWLDDRVPDEEPPKSKWELLKGIIPKMPFGEAAETALALGSGAVAGPVSGYVGALGAMLPGKEGQGADWVQRTQNALTYEPTSKNAKNVLGAISYLPEKYAEGANLVGEQATDLTGSPLVGTVANTLIQGLPYLVGAGVKTVAPTGATQAALSTRNAARVANLTADTAAADAKSAGFALPPSQVNSTLGNRLAEWYAGAGPTSEALSKKNQPLSQAKYREDLGMAPGTPLDKVAYDAVRARESPHYNAVRQYGESPVSNAYATELANMEGPIRNMASKYPKDAPPPILKEIDSVFQGKIDANAALDKIRDLRNDARKAGSGLQPDDVLAAQYWKLAKVVEDELDRHLKRAGAPADVIDNYRSARETIAKADTAEYRTKPSGEVDAKAAAKDLKAPFDLTGGMREVAGLGANFKKASRLPSEIGSGSQQGSGLKGLLGGDLLANVLAGDWYQKNFVKPPTYGRTFGDRLVSQASNPAYPLAGEGLGQEADARKRAFIELLMRDRQ